MKNSSSSETRAHHEFGPSRLEYLDHCAAFTNRKGETNEAADEGTQLHDVMAAILTKVTEGQYKTCTEQLRDWVTADNAFTDDQQTWLRVCCRQCDEAIEQKPITILVEVPVTTYRPDGTELNYGYLDVVFIYEGGYAIVVDFKFGWIPVPHAKDNLQGKNYVLSIFQQQPDVNTIGLVFIQPKLNSVTDAEFKREQMYALYDEIEKVIHDANWVIQHPEDAQSHMSPGPFCDYCALKGSCSVLANHRAEAGARMSELPVPAGFKAMQLHTPEQWALARYWCDVVETGIDELKKGAMAVAEANGGVITCKLPNGEEVVYDIKERKVDRILGDTKLVADYLKDLMTLEEIIGCADLSLTKLLKRATESLVEIKKLENEKMTKKRATEIVESNLTSAGLLSQPDTRIRYLKLRKAAKGEVKQLPAADQNAGTGLTVIGQQGYDEEFNAGAAAAQAGQPLPPSYSGAFLEGYKAVKPD